MALAVACVLAMMQDAWVEREPTLVVLCCAVLGGCLGVVQLAVLRSGRTKLWFSVFAGVLGSCMASLPQVASDCLVVQLSPLFAFGVGYVLLLFSARWAADPGDSSGAHG